MPSSFFSRSLMALVCAMSALAGRAHGQAPYLVKDIDPGVPGSLLHPVSLTVAGGALYLFAGTSGGGGGLMRIDQGGAVTPLAPFAVGATSSFRMAAAGDRIFFSTGGSLWTSDGTPSGTTLVRTFPPPGAGAVAAVGDTAYFRVVDGSVGELWKSDGTAAGTVRLATVEVESLTATATRLFFVEFGTKGLWTSDGTVGGTRRLGTTTVAAPFDQASVVGDTLFFAGIVTGTVADLWRTDGTDAGTVKIKSFTPSALEGFLPRCLTRFGSSLLFAGGAPEGLWKTDGTESGTVEVRADLKIREIHASGSAAFLHGRDSEAGAEVWKTDGTTEGTARVTDACPGPCNFLNAGWADFAALPSGATFVRNFGDLWATDGTAAGTGPLGSFPMSSTFVNGVLRQTSFGGAVYFAGNDGTRYALWKTDGTPGGTVEVQGAVGGPGSDPRFAGGAGDHVLFGAFRPDLGDELWTTLGTETSTLPIELVPGPSGSSFLKLFSLGQRFVFGHPLGGVWSTDGTPGGTGPVAPIDVWKNRWRVANGDVGLFVGGEQLFQTDASTAGTFRVRPPVGLATDTSVGAWDEALAAYTNGFAAVMGGVDPQPLSVWLVGKGAEQATLLIEEDCLFGRGVEELLFLNCVEAGSFSLWISDGSRAGTRLLVDLPGQPKPGWVASEGRLYFRVYEQSAGGQLWTSDGTAAGTHAVTATVPLPADFNPQGMTASNGLLFFDAATPEAGRELWRTDGTPLGTFMLRDIDPGPASGIADYDELLSEPRLVAAGGGVLFAASTADRGSELWRTDGTAVGTVPIPEIAPGALSSSPRHLFHHRGRVYFAADDGLRGAEPWALELPPAVSVGDVTVTEGDAGTASATFVVRLEPPSTAAVTVAYTTAAGSASAGSDFVATAGVLTFAPGTTEAAVDVPVVGDETEESTESFALQVVPMAGIAAADARGATVIVDDDAPRVSVAGASVTEGDSGTADAVFPVTLTTGDGQPTAAAVTVRVEVEYGTASASDFPPSTIPPPSVTFPAGSASGTTLPLPIPVQGDTLDEPNETFSLALDAGNDATLPEPGSITGVIVDDDGVAAAPPVEISHGSRVLADLAPPVGRASDVDFYALRHDLHSSYEIVVDAVSGDAAPIAVERVLADGGVFQTAVPTGTGNSVALRFFGLGVSTDHIRVRSAACGTTCGPDDVYRLRMYETTLRSPRVNTVGPQATALIVQNTTDAPIAAVAGYWSVGGVLSSVQAFDVPAHGTAVVDVGAVLSEFSGSVTIGHNGPYGGLVGKVVSIDPATGFSFESPLTAKAR